MKFKGVNGNVVLRKVEKSGTFTYSEANKERNVGIVVEEFYEFKEGMKVIFNNENAFEYKDYIIVGAEDILVVIEED